MRTAIITDSNSGIFQEEAENLGIFSVPMPVFMQNFFYYEGINLDYETFLRALTKGERLSTSQPSPGDLMSMWEMAFKEGYEEILYLPMSSSLSGSYNTACLLAEDYPGRVYVADVRRISVTQRHAVLDALALSQQGLHAKEIKERLEENALRSIIFVGVSSLDYLKRGGRITPAAAAMASVLNIRPLLVIRGNQVDAFEKIRGQKRCAKRLIQLMQEHTEQLKKEGFRVRVGAAGSFLTEADRTQWYQQVKAAFPEDDVFCDPLTCSISCHVGPNAFGMGISAVIH